MGFGKREKFCEVFDLSVLDFINEFKDGSFIVWFVYSVVKEVYWL